jgi:hypothetical protein
MTPVGDEIYEKFRGRKEVWDKYWSECSVRVLSLCALVTSSDTFDEDRGNNTLPHCKGRKINILRTVNNLVSEVQYC